MLSGVPQLKKAVMGFMEKMHVLEMFHWGTSYRAVGAMSSMLRNQHYLLNKVSLDRNTHKTRCVLIG